jgi:hypothetical protein
MIGFQMKKQSHFLKRLRFVILDGTRVLGIASYQWSNLMKYDDIQVARELFATAQGDAYYGNALYVVKDRQDLSVEEKVAVISYLRGNITATHRFVLQDLAIRIGYDGKPAK